MAAAATSTNTSSSTFMFHPRTAVFEHPVTYNIPPTDAATTTQTVRDDFSQYYITLEARTTLLKSAKGPICIAECDTQGRSIVVENTSRSKSVALAGWIIRQETDQGETLTFTFPDNCLLRPNHSLKIYTKTSESDRKNGDLVASSLSTWHTGSNVVTTLINADGKDRASLTKKTLFS